MGTLCLEISTGMVLCYVGCVFLCSLDWKCYIGWELGMGFALFKGYCLTF